MKNRIKTLGLLLCMATGMMTAGAQHKIAMSSGIIEFKELMEVEVQGYDGNEVILETSGNYKIPERAKGLRPVNGLGLVDNTGIGLAVKEEAKGHQVVYQVSRNSDAKYLAKVPKGVVVKYVNSSIHGDDFRARNISNEIEVKTHGGDIKLTDVTGPLSANSVHGDIEVVFTSVTQKLPSSIASVHGDVDVAIPTATKADLSIATTWGEVYSDLDIKVETSNGMKVYGAKRINGKLNSGGVGMSVSSTHGNVYLRKK
ncbi:MAG: DUF4097 domain-containing protein [Cytophagales bacterium]|nr:DUF4097 domain-containing protein [Cytophagales bacterium]